MLIGGRKLRGGFQNSLGRVSIPSALWKIGHYENIKTRVFDGSPPNLQVAIQAFKDEANLWQFAGAKGLTTLCLELGRIQT